MTAPPRRPRGIPRPGPEQWAAISPLHPRLLEMDANEGRMALPFSPLMIPVTPHDEPLQRQLAAIHEELQRELPGIGRVAVALYDPETDLLRTFLHSTQGEVPFALYEARLGDVPSLGELAASGRERVIHDLVALAGSGAVHTRRLLEVGFRSSYARPFYDRRELRGFLFYDAVTPGFFSEAVVGHLAVYSHLVALLVLHALAPADLLRSAVEVAREMSHLRDQETGAHLDRMARYARIIASEVAAREGRDDEFVEFVFLLAPLHDVGKIAIPDRVLLKPGRLSSEEFELMKSHVERGEQLVASLARAFGLLDSDRVELLRNIVACHHEAIDGSGYPRGLAGAQIPLEARIVAVADAFDALTTERPYKHAWTNDEAFAFLEERAGRRFDAECVRALAVRRGDVEAIQRHFAQAADRLPEFHEAYLDSL